MAVGGVVLLVAAAFFALRGTWGMYGKLASASEGASAAMRQLQSLEARRTQIGADIERLSTERGVEGELRERYGLAKPGEGVIQVVENADAPASVGAVQAESLLQKVFHTLLPW